MVPSKQQCLLLFDRFELPSQKRIHVEEVARLSMFLADKLITKGIKIDKPLLEAACLLHDIDKNITRKIGEVHPQTAARVLNEFGFGEVARLVEYHSVHFILDPKTSPKTWEEKILFLADKMTKYEVIGLEHRFKLWYRENLPKESVDMLKNTYPKVLALQKEIFDLLEINEGSVLRELQQ